MAILCFGSENEKDELAWEISYALNGRRCADVHALKDGDIIVDVVKGLDKVKIIKTEELDSKEFATSHDFDLQTYLKLMEILNDFKITIIGIPIGYEKEQAIKEVKEILQSINNEN